MMSCGFWRVKGFIIATDEHLCQADGTEVDIIDMELGWRLERGRTELNGGSQRRHGVKGLRLELWFYP
jgi:hypothetical protein